MAKNTKRTAPKTAVKKTAADDLFAVEGVEDAAIEEAVDPEPRLRYTLDWHLTLTNILLWVLAAVDVYEGLRLVTGRVYHSLRSQVYSYFSGLQTVNTVFGVCFVLWAGCAIYVRFQLARFKTGAPRKLQLLDAVALALSVAHLLATSLVTKTAITASLTASNTGMLVFEAALLALNGVYYRGIGSLFNK